MGGRRWDAVGGWEVGSGRWRWKVGGWELEIGGRWAVGSGRLEVRRGRWGLGRGVQVGVERGKWEVRGVGWRDGHQAGLALIALRWKNRPYTMVPRCSLQVYSSTSPPQRLHGQAHFPDATCTTYCSASTVHHGASQTLGEVFDNKL